MFCRMKINIAYKENNVTNPDISSEQNSETNSDGEVGKKL